MTTQRDAGKGTGEARRPDMAGLRTAVRQVFAAASPAGGPDVLGIEVLDVLGGSPNRLRVLAMLRSPITHAIMRVPLHLSIAQRVG